MLRIGTAEYFNSLEQFLKHLPVGNDPEILVLKGHLLVERLLEKYLAENLPNPGVLEDAGLSFAQKLALVAALNQDSSAEWLWAAIRLLNRLRNELVHRLDSTRYNSVLMEFLTRIESSPDLPDLEAPGEMTERLHRAIFAVHEAMSHRVDL